jgi:hypothetical protein
MRVGFQSCGNTTGCPSPAQMRPLSGLIKTLWIHQHRPDEPTHGERTSKIMATVERLGVADGWFRINRHPENFLA